MALYDHEGTRGLAPLSILGEAPGNLTGKPTEPTHDRPTFCQ